MADHLRNQIRDRVATQLTGLTTTGSNVFQTPIVTGEEQTFPALAIYITNEVTGETATMGHLDRECELHIDGYSDASATILDTLDLISKEVEIQMQSSSGSPVSAIVEHYYLTGTDIEIRNQDTRPVGVVMMTYYVRYRTTQVAPDVNV
tara:strand:+ start:4845 stop:5291 length:447 start_codon:yes stop_codon:yes gene_type:complete